MSGRSTTGRVQTRYAQPLPSIENYNPNRKAGFWKRNVMRVPGG